MFRTGFLIYLAITSPVSGAQSPHRLEWSVLAQKSSAVVVGIIERISPVVDPNKIAMRSETLPDGQVLMELPNPSEYVVGRIALMRVEDVIKKDGKAKTGSTINIFLPGRLPTEGEPIVVEKEKYLVFLTPLKTDNNHFAGMKIYQRDTPAVKQEMFDPRSKYIIVGGNNGASLITAKNSRVIDEVRAAVRQD